MGEEELRPRMILETHLPPTQPSSNLILFFKSRLFFSGYKSNACFVTVNTEKHKEIKHSIVPPPGDDHYSYLGIHLRILPRIVCTS